MTGNPAASIPCGFVSSGLRGSGEEKGRSLELPVGLQVVGKFGDDALVLRASAALEEARPWAGKRPPVS